MDCWSPKTRNTNTITILMFLYFQNQIYLDSIFQLDADFTFLYPCAAITAWENLISIFEF